MKIGDYETHPAADIFPMLSGEELETLAEDIAAFGLRHPIVLCEEKVLDGRNRLKACIRAKSKPRFVNWKPKREETPLDYVVSANLYRRHLNESQRGMIAARVATRTKGQPSKSNRSIDLLTQDEAAERFNVSVPSVKRARVVLDSKDKTLIKAVDDGDVPVSVAATVAARPGPERREFVDHVRDGKKPVEALRQLKKDRLTDRIAELPDNVFRVLYADPPWQYGDTRVGVDGYSKTAAEDHYPTASVHEISSLGIGGIAADDAVLFCWATFPLLPDALKVIGAWGFHYKTAIVWAKDRPNFGHYHRADAELLLICTRGSCTPDSDTRESQVQTIKRTGRHSQKPAEFREMIDRMYPHGKRVELFARGEAPKGWDVWGNEAVSSAS